MKLVDTDTGNVNARDKYGELLRRAADAASCVQSMHSGLQTHHQSEEMVMSGYSCVDAFIRFGKGSEVEAWTPTDFDVVGREFVVTFRCLSVM